MDDMQNSVCIICHGQRSEGIRICSRFICADCEREIVRTDVVDGNYGYFIDQMKQIWRDIKGLA
ncbi:MAG TPA: sigma factor G inhibitor Gin [Bacilli bacterium]